MTADESGSVIELESQQETFCIGSIPAELGSLTNLKTLRMAGNSLVGSIPVELGNLTALTNLDLQDNILIGSIPSRTGQTLQSGMAGSCRRNQPERIDPA